MKTRQVFRTAGLFAILLFLIGISTARAQAGSSCKDAIALPTGGGCEQGIQTTDTVYWFYFVPDSSKAIIILSNYATGDSIMTQTVLYSGDCDNLTVVATSVQEPYGLVIIASGLTPSNTYYVKTRRTTTDETLFDLCWGNLSSTVAACACPSSLVYPNGQCNMVCNGDFEYYSGTIQPNMVDNACPWFKLFGTSDYFHPNGPVFGGNSWQAPGNFQGTQSSYNGGQAYAGFAAYGPNDYREYVVQQLNSPMVAGQSYHVSFRVSFADYAEMASKNIGALFTNAAPTQIGNSPLNINAQIIETNYITNRTGWTLISGTYTSVNGGEQFITLGNFLSNAQSPGWWQQVPNNPNPQQAQFGYYYLDSVWVKPASMVAYATPANLCLGGSAALTVNSPYGNVTYTWTPSSYLNATTGQFVISTPPTAGSYTYTCTITLPNYNNCILTDTAHFDAWQGPTVSAGPNDTICSSQQVTLTGSITSGIATGYHWYPLGGSPLCSNCSTAVVTPTVTTTYIFWAQDNHNGCTDTDTMIVYVNPAPQGPITANTFATTCGGSIQFSVPGSYSSYSWTSNGTPATGSNSTFTTSWNATANNGLVSVVLTTAQGCSGTLLDTIPGCCTNGSQNNLLNTQTSNIPSQYPGLGSYSGGYFEIDGQTFSVNGLLTVDQNMRWKGCNVYMGMDAKIVISPGIKFEITANASSVVTKIKACDYMWDGIFVDGTNSLSEILVNTGSVIEDAKNAIVSIKGGKFTIAGTSPTQKVKLNKNKIAIHVQKHTGTHPGTVKNTVISCDYATGQPGYTSGWTYTGSVCRPPYSQKSYFGILIDDNVGITIGDSSSNTQRNIFERLRYGIYSRSSTVKIWNNDLKYIQGTPQPLSSPMQEGMAIYANGGLWPQSYTVTVGNTGTVNAGNSFINCTYGVRADSYLHSSIQNNIFDTILATGITTVGCKMRTQLINKNSFMEYKTGIQVVDPYKSTVTISNNSMNQFNQPIPTTFGNAGIVVLNAVQTNVTLNIFSNTIRKCRIGIWVSRVKNPKIYDNSQITFYANQPATPASPAMGIKIEGCTNALVKNNAVSYSVTPSTNLHDRFFGIHVTNCFNDSIYKNTLTKMGSGIFLKGADNPSLISCNTMTSCAYGVNFNFTNGNFQVPVSVNDQIRWQNVTPTPTGNTWSGCNKDIIGVIDPNNSIYWYRNNTYNPSTNMLNLSFMGNVTTNLGSASDQCSSLFISPGPADQRNYTLSGIAKTPRTYDTLNNEFRYIDRVNAYRMLRDNPSWLALNHADDSYYQTFYSSENNTSIGKFADAEDAIEQDQLQAAAILVISITPVGKPEENRQAVMQIYLDTWAKASPVLNDAQKNILQPMISQHSVSGGNAVFDARNMLYEEVNDSGMARIEPPAVLTGIFSENGGLYPNPTTGDMTLVWQLAETEQGEVEVYDLSGRIVLRTALQSGNTHKVNTVMLQNGTYLLRVVINGHPVQTGRIVVLKQD